jgi:CheY-like chemotaxis protein
MAQPNPEAPLEILLVEDNEDEAYLTMDALQEGRVRNRITRVEDGVEAMAFLRREGRYAQAPRPDLILLDTRMPRMNGLEVLKEVKSDANLRQIPIVMLTGTDDDETVRRAYDLHVNCYVTMPVDIDQFLGVVRSIAQFWFGIVKLPPAP